MTTLEIVLIIILYIVIGIKNIKPFYKVTDQSKFTTLVWCLTWPIVWVIILFVFVIPVGIREFF